MTKKKKRKVRKKPIIILFLFFIIMGGGIYYIVNYLGKDQKKEVFLASITYDISLYDLETLEEIEKLPRGSKVDVYLKQKDEENVRIFYQGKDYYVLKENISYNIHDVVKEKEIYVRTSYNLKEKEDDIKLLDLCQKGDKLKVLDYDEIDSSGKVHMYKVETSEKKIGYFYGEYIMLTEEEAKKNYDEDGLYKIHASRKDTYGGGSAGTLDYYPVEKPHFTDNVMPKSSYSLYLNGTKGVINIIDEYIELAKSTKINTFIVDILDDTVVSYSSPVMKEISPTSYKYAQNSLENFQKAIKKLKDNGFYVVGRITAFKDSYYVSDHKENAISNTNGEPLLHQKSYWPTAFSRDVWEYKIMLAKEAVNLMGFNEIQFDYVRFPDGLGTKEKNNTVDYHNTYKETKIEAIQRFLMYAKDEIHKVNAYVSADVFGECSGLTSKGVYVTSYGQYWPAISNVVDVISSMPYTDHFGNTYANHTSPWLYPYDTVYYWAKIASERQKEIKTPAIARTWITAYNTPWTGASPKLAYNAKEVEEEIKALYDAGLTGGYMTWNAYSATNNINKYKLQKDAYNKEYYHEENNNNE